MDDALRAFLTGLIDYAGLFPPAKLKMSVALENFLSYRNEADRWMLGRFICPASRLTELADLLENGIDPVPLAVILDDAEALETAPAVLGARARVEVCEGRGAGPRSMVFFRELGFPENWRETLPAELQALPPGHGLKIRCGGLDPTAFPSVEQVAGAMRLCRTAKVPFKATAGLHHPLRHEHETIDATAHGFLNVFGAGVLGAVHDLPEETLREILTSRDPADFSFKDGVFSAFGFSAGVREVVEARKSFARSFGSCSFDEPRDDLRALGFMA